MKPRSASKSHDPETFPVSFPPLQAAQTGIGRTDWAEFIQKRSNRRESEDSDTSVFTERGVEVGRSDLAKLYYKDSSAQSSPSKCPRPHHRVRPLSLTSTSSPKPQAPFQLLSKETIEEIADKVEIRLQALRNSVNLEEAMRVVDEGWIQMQRNLEPSRSAEANSLRRMVLMYKRVAEAARTSYADAKCAYENHKCPTVERSRPQEENKVPSIAEQIARQAEAKRQLEELEECLNQDTEAYETLKKSIIALLEKTSPGTDEYLERLYHEMKHEYSMPDTKSAEIPQMELPEWEMALRYRFSEVQKMTAQKVFSFCQKRNVGTSVCSQTEGELVDEVTYREVVKRAAAAELRRDEIRTQMDELSEQVATKMKLLGKLQSELDTALDVKSRLFTENSSLQQEVKRLEREQHFDQNELASLRLSSKSLRKEVKSMAKSLEALRQELNSQQIAITQLEEIKEEQTSAVAETKQELRILYKQYFQPKTLSRMSAENRETRRRSVSGPRTDRKTEETRIVARNRRRIGSAEKGKRNIMETLGLDLDIVSDNSEKKVAEVSVESQEKEENNAEIDQNPVAEVSQVDEEEIKQVLGSQESFVEDWSKNDIFPAISAQKSPTSRIESHIIPNKEEEESRQSLASTHIDVKTRREEMPSKFSISSSATKRVESALEEESEGRTSLNIALMEKYDREIEGNQSNPAGERMKNGEADTEIRPNQQFPPISFSPTALPTCPEPISLPVKESVNKWTMTDSVISCMSTVCTSVGVQFDSERPHMTYEEDGSFQGPDGVRYYMWPLNPNQLYGLSGDVFYHTVMRVFSSMPKVPLARTGEPYQPQYRLADVEGTRIPVDLEISSTQPRKPHDPRTCSKDCSHHSRKGKPRREEKLWPVAKQDIRY